MRKIQKKSDEEYLLKIRTITDSRPSYGYRRVTALLNRQLSLEGKPRVNPKKVYRIMKAHKLLLAKFGKKSIRVHDGKVSTIRSNLRWCTDGFGIQCWNGERLEVVFSLDCCDREAMSWLASSRGIDGAMVRDLIAESVEARFGVVKTLPEKIQWLSDNGPGFVARETVFFARQLGFEVCTTAPYSPESNGMAEAFVKTFKRDYVYLGDLSSAQRVLEQLPRWFADYNKFHPHKALKMKSPSEYRKETLVS